MAKFIEATYGSKKRKTWINIDLVTEFFEHEGGTRFLFQIPDGTGDVMYTDVEEPVNSILRQIPE